MLTGLDPKQVIEYVSVLEKDKENPTKFMFGVISGKDRIVLMSKFEVNETDPACYYELVKKGLKSIKGLSGKDYDTITDEVLDVIPTVILKELFGEILKLNFLSEIEIKN